MVDVAPFLTALERAGYRLTEPRREVASLIDGHRLELFGLCPDCQAI